MLPLDGSVPTVLVIAPRRSTALGRPLGADAARPVFLPRAFLCVGLVGLTLLLGCGGDPRLRVDDSVLERITIENKLLLFDAENELDMAIDDRDQVLDAIDFVQAERRRILERRDLARRDVDVFRSKRDDGQARVAALRVEAAEARLSHLGARLEVERVRLERAERALVVARARFELAKARLVKRNNVPGAAGLDLAAFEQQVDAYGKRVFALDPKLEEAEARAAEHEKRWAASAARLREASGGAYGSRWLD